MMKVINFFVLNLMLLLSFSGCGDLTKKKVVKNNLDSNIGKVNCELEIGNFSKILTENVSSDIKCLGETLKVFINVVETDKPGYLSRTRLEQYILRNRTDIKPEVLKVLKAVFDLNFLVFGENPDYISWPNIKELIDFALLFNEQSKLTFDLFKAKDPATFPRHIKEKGTVESAAKKVTLGLKNIFNSNRNGAVHKLNIVDLLESFTTEANRDSIEDVKKLLFAKKILVGGENEILTHVELGRLILSFDQLVLIGFDVVRYKYIQLNQSSILELLKTDVDLLGNIIFQSAIGNRDDEVFVSIEDAFEAIKLLVDQQSFDVDKFRNLMVEGKKIILGGNDQEIMGRDFKQLFDHATKLLKTGTVFHRMYKLFPALELPTPVNIDFNENRNQYPGNEEELKNFIRIVTKYRFMRGEFESAYYSTPYRRNASGVFEIAIIEYVLKLVMAYKDQNGVAWGRPSNGLGGYSMSAEDVLALVKRFEKELIEMEIILPKKAASTADTISLLGSLFQYQSDDNKLLDVNEATEFAISLFTSLSVAENLMTYFKEIGCQTDQFDRVEPNCFRKNYWLAICKTGYAPYYERLFQALGVSVPKMCEQVQNNQANNDYLNMSILAARSCNYYTDGAKEEIWFSEGDTFSLFVAMMHIEATIIRWDTTQPLNNIMDANEVENAYSIYSPALDGFVSGITAKFKKQIYQYLIKYESAPDEKQFSSIWKFIKFLVSFNKKAPASRKTIAAILKTISDQSAKSAANSGQPKFDCNLLRDPTRIEENMGANGTVRLPDVTPIIKNLTNEDRKQLNFVEQMNDEDIRRELFETDPLLFSPSRI